MHNCTSRDINKYFWGIFLILTLYVSLLYANSSLLLSTCDSFSILFLNYFRLLLHFIQIYHIFFNAGPGVSTDHCYTDLRSSLSLSFSLLHSLLFTPFWYTQEVISFSATHSFSINSYCWSCLLFSFNI